MKTETMANSLDRRAGILVRMRELESWKCQQETQVLGQLIEAYPELAGEIAALMMAWSDGPAAYARAAKPFERGERIPERGSNPYDSATPRSIRGKAVSYAILDDANFFAMESVPDAAKAIETMGTLRRMPCEACAQPDPVVPAAPRVDDQLLEAANELKMAAKAMLATPTPLGQVAEACAADHDRAREAMVKAMGVPAELLTGGFTSLGDAASTVIGAAREKGSRNALRQDRRLLGRVVALGDADALQDRPTSVRVRYEAEALHRQAFAAGKAAGVALHALHEVLPGLPSDMREESARDRVPQIVESRASALQDANDEQGLNELLRRYEEFDRTQQRYQRIRQLTRATGYGASSVEMTVNEALALFDDG